MWLRSASSAALSLGKVPAPRPDMSIAGRWAARRDRLLVSRKFQAWAARFALTRPLVRRRASALFDLIAGFVYSQVLLACVRLDLFEVLAETPQTAAALASRLDMPLASMQRLLDAAVPLRLLERRRGGLYGLGPLGAPMSGNAALRSMVEHHGALYADLRDPLALMRGHSGAHGGAQHGNLAGFWPYAGAPSPVSLDAHSVAAYSSLMAASLSLVGDEILDAYAVSSHRCLLDVGGGEGAFVASAARRAPDLQLMLFDLPAVAVRAQSRLAAWGLSRRSQVFGGDFFSEPLPKGADLITLIRVIHDHDDADALRLLKSVRAALAPGGTVLLAEPMARTRGAEAMGDAYFGIYLLAMGSGRPRSAGELTAMLQEAGFTTVRQLRTQLPLQAGVLMARSKLA